MKKDFNYYFDDLCKENKKEKERKKQVFNENVKPHIVYMDEDGKTYKGKDNKPMKKPSNKPSNNTIYYLLLFFFIICVLLEIMKFIQ